jgi:hypothetical protein
MEKYTTSTNEFELCLNILKLLVYTKVIKIYKCSNKNRF